MSVSFIRIAPLPACGTPPSFPKVFHKAHRIQRAGRSVSSEYRTDQGEHDLFGGSVQHHGSAAQHTPTAPTCSHPSQAHFLHHFLLHKKALFAPGLPCTAVSSLIHAMQGISFLGGFFLSPPRCK